MEMIQPIDGPSQHLSWSELSCKDGTKYPEAFILDGRIFRLAAVFEEIRHVWERPITILSAFRTFAHNKSVGGAKNSQHMAGRALDLLPPKGVKLRDFYDIIKSNAMDFDIHGLGHYKTFVHVDIRLSDKIAVWSGDGVKDSVAQTVRFA